MLTFGKEGVFQTFLKRPIQLYGHPAVCIPSRVNSEIGKIVKIQRKG